MQYLPAESPKENPDGVKKIDLFTDENAARNKGAFSSESASLIGERIARGGFRRSFWNPPRIVVALTILLFLSGGILVIVRVMFPQPGRIYHTTNYFTSEWTERDLERVFGSSGKLVSGSRGSPNGYALEWKGKGSYHLIRFDANGRQVGSTGRSRGTTIFEDIAAFFGLPEPWSWLDP